MDDKDIEKIEEIIKERKCAHEFFLKNSKVYRSFVDLEQKHFQMEILERNIKN